MSQSGYTPLLIYGSGTSTNTPIAANLTSSSSGCELAINYADGKLFYKDNSGTVQVLATKSATSGTFSQITSTVSTGTPPFVVSSTTQVANLNAATAGTAISATTATSATKISNSGGWTVQTGGTATVLEFSYNGTVVASLDSSGNFIALANVTASGTPA